MPWKLKVLTLLSMSTGISLGQVLTRSDLAATDTFYSKSTGFLYVATSSTSGHAPNSIVVIDPVSGKDVSVIAAGNNPTEVAGSDDGNYLYAYLQGDQLIRRFNLQTQQAEFDFSAVLTGGPSNSVPIRMLVIQGNPDQLMVSFGSPSGNGEMALFQHGAQLPDIVTQFGCASTIYGADPSTLLCYGGAVQAHGSSLRQLQLSATGIHAGAELAAIPADLRPVKSFNGQLYFGNGLVTDLSGKVELGQFTIGNTTDFALSTDGTLIYFVGLGFISVMDRTTYTPVAATSSAPPVFRAVVGYGVGGIAGILDYQAGPLAILPLSAIPPIPVAPIGAVWSGDDGVKHLAMYAGALVYHARSDTLLADVPQSIPKYGNRLFKIEPNSLAIGDSIFTGSDPWLLTLTDSSNFAYQALATNVVQRINLATFQIDRTVPIYSYLGNPITVSSIVPLNNSDDSFAVARTGGPHSLPDPDSIAIYDGSIPRSIAATVPYNLLTTAVAISSDGRSVYGLNGASTLPRFSRFPIASGGVFTPDAELDIPQGATFYTGIACQQDICFDSYGDVMDGRSMRMLGVCTFPNIGPFLIPTVLPDTVNNRAHYLLTAIDGGAVYIASCDLKTFLPSELWGTAARASFNGSLVFTRPGQFAISTGTEIITIPKSALKPLVTTPAIQPAPVGITQVLPIFSNFGVYDPVRDRLYISLDASIIGPSGNRVGIVNPSTGKLEDSILVGGEATSIAINSDASYLWVAVEPSHKVVRLNLATRSIDQTIVLPLAPDGLGSSVGGFTVLAGVPNQPKSVAVSAVGIGTVLFDDGVQRGKPVLRVLTALGFSAAGDLLAGHDAGGLCRFEVNSTGLSNDTCINESANSNSVFGLGSTPDLTPVLHADQITIFKGRIYTSAGAIFDLATLNLLDRIVTASAIPDPASNRIYTAFGDGVHVFDATSLAQIATYHGDASFQINVNSQMIIPCGPQRIAILALNGITFIPFANLNLTQPAKLPSAVAPDVDGVTRLRFGIKDIAWDAPANRLLAISGATGGPDGNSLLTIDPLSGDVAHVPIGNNPVSLSVAPDAHVAFVAFSGTQTVARINLDSAKLETAQPVPPVDPVNSHLILDQVAALSAVTNSVLLMAHALNDFADEHPELIALDGATPRHNVAGLFPTQWSYRKFFPTDKASSVVYAGYNGFVASGEISANGTVRVDPPQSGLRSFRNGAVCAGLVYLDSGQVWDPSNNQIVRDYHIWSVTSDPFPIVSAVSCDGASDRVYFGIGGDPASTVSAYAISTSTFLGSYRLGAIDGDISAIVGAGSYIAVLSTGGTLALLRASSLELTPPTPAITSVLNAASLAPGPFAPGSLITIRGTALADWVDQTATSSAFPFSIGDSTVRIQSQGSSVKENAYLQYVSPMQINAQISAFLSPGPATLTLSVGGRSTQIAIAIAATGPGLFTSNGNATVLNLDGTVNSSSNAAPATSMITAFITGQGRTHPYE